MFLTSPYIDQAIALKFRLLSIQFTSEAFVSSRKMVGIELGRVCCRRRVTTLTLSVARWVHNSAMATFSEAPL
jgi:hypothetical protein